MTRLGERVRLLGFVPASDLGPLYAAAEVFCFPSFREGFGLPVLEAMSQGTPVVTSSDTALAELVGTDPAVAGGLVVDPRDPHALGAALASVVTDADLSARLGAAARRRAGSYTWERTATALVDAYREAAGAAAGPTARVGGAGAHRRDRRWTIASVTSSPPRPGRGARRGDRARVGCNLLWLVPGDVGGSEEYTVRLLRAIADRSDPEVVPVLFVNGSFASVYADLTNHFETVLAPVDGVSRVQRVVAESTWLAAAVRRHGIELTHHLGGTVPVVRPTASLVTIHDLQPLAMPEHFRPVKRRYLATVAPWSCRVADRVVTLTRFAQLDVVARTGVEEARTSVVPPGLDAVDPVPDSELAAVRRRYGLADHPFFLYPAIPYPHKNHRLLLRALAGVGRRVPGALVVFTGGAGPLDAELEAEARRLGVTAAVRRPGRIPWSDVDALYRSATALTFPSSYEGFGMPTLEAMTRGCPVLAADAGALPEVVGTGGQLLDPGDESAWEEAMVAVVREPARRHELIAAGRARATAFDWGRSADALLDAWRSVAARTAVAT
jgi:alpha-1,3-rhamnosyl/mannosyltransferase